MIETLIDSTIASEVFSLKNLLIMGGIHDSPYLPLQCDSGEMVQ